MILLDGIMKEQENTKESKETKPNSFLGSVICSQATCKYEQISNNVMFCEKHGRATQVGCL